MGDGANAQADAAQWRRDEEIRAEAQRAKDLRRIGTACVATLAVGFIAVSLYGVAIAANRHGIVKVIGASCLIGGGAFLVGALVGFLFGIPRTLQQVENPKKDAKEPDKDDGPSYQVNTNLEQISDWLTKILVGVGLTQLLSLRENLGSVSLTMARAIGEPQAAKPVVAALLVFFASSGFFFGYLITRLFLTAAFRRAERLPRTVVEEVVSKVEDRLMQNQQATADTLGWFSESQLIRFLYEPEPDGFRRAIQFGEQLVQQAAPIPRLPFYMAAAYGQMHGWEKGHDKRPDELQKARDNALKYARLALKTDPAQKAQLDQLLHPKEGDVDDDMASLSGDPEFEKLVADAAAPEAKQAVNQ